MSLAQQLRMAYSRPVNDRICRTNHVLLATQLQPTADEVGCAM